jgi:uncharacterized membrane protein YfcA
MRFARVPTSWWRWSTNAPPRRGSARHLQFISFVGASISLATLWAVGRFGTTELAPTAILAPASVMGFWLSHFGIRRVDAARVRLAVLVLSSVAALRVLCHALTATMAGG